MLTRLSIEHTSSCYDSYVNNETAKEGIMPFIPKYVCSCAKSITPTRILQRMKLSKFQESLYNSMSHLSIDALQFVSKYLLKYRLTKEKKPHTMSTTTNIGPEMIETTR